MGILCVAFVIVLAGIALKIYIKLNTGWNNSYACLNGKTVIVTGANTGLGYATALDFAMRGARVILACRSKERAEEARRKIVNATGNEKVIVKILDLASFESVREFADDFNKTEAKLDILINNAALVVTDEKKAEDGLPYTMKINHLSPFLLTHLLIDKLKASQHSRVVNMSSYMAKYSKLQAEEMDVIPKPQGMYTSGTVAYNNSKLCNVLFTMELEKKLQGSGISVYTVHPGATKTDIQRDPPAFFHVVMLFLSHFLWTPEEGAQTTIYCALSKEVEDHEGAMYGNCKEIGTYEPAKDVTLARKVWENSEKLVQLTEKEKLK